MLTFEEFGQAFPSRAKKRKSKARKNTHIRPANDEVLEEPTQGLHQTMLGDEIVDDAWETLFSKCSALKATLEKQQATGVDYNTFRNVTTFFAQLSRSDLAHRFAALHPYYAENYESRSDGYDCTQKIIDQVRRANLSGYIGYEALGFPDNPCGHRGISNNPSPIRHLLLSRGIARFMEYNPATKKLALKTSLVVDEINRRFHLIYVGEEDAFYWFAGVRWIKKSNAEIAAFVNDVMDNDGEPTHVKNVSEKLKLTNLDYDFCQKTSKNYICFADGILDIARLMDNSVSRDQISHIELKDLPFKTYAEMNLAEIKALKIVCTLNVRFDPSAQIEEFRRYLASTFKGFEEVISIVQEMFGYCLILAYPLHNWFLLIGPGGNGKGVLLHLLAIVLGSDNVSYINMAELTRFATAGLQHKTLNITDELSKNGSNWDRIKNMTGGGRTAAEIKFGPTYSFPSTAKLAVTTNELPNISDASTAFWDRVVIIPFENSFRNLAGQIPNYEEILAKEADGIAYWALEGLVRLLRRGKFELPAACRAMISKARSQTDSVRSFVDERCILDQRCAELKSTLYRAYLYYCQAHGVRPLGQKKFSERLKSLGIDIESREPANIAPRSHLYVGIGYNYHLGQPDVDYASRSNIPDDAWLLKRPSQFCIQTEHLANNSSYCLSCPTQCRMSTCPSDKIPPPPKVVPPNSRHRNPEFVGMV